MKLAIHLQAAGAERLALGQTLYSWDFYASIPKEGEETPGLPGLQFLCVIDAPLPSRDVCTKLALDALAAKEKSIQAEAYKEMMEVKDRKEKLLCLSYSPDTQEQS